MKLKSYSSILFAGIFVLLNSKGFSQGTGDHLTMSLENCSNPAANIIQFDLFVTSDGASGSDLRPNSFSFGVNFDTCILRTGATVTISYVTGTTDGIFPSPGLSFPPSTFPDHIRITQSPCSNCNSSSNSMIIGHKYRIGTLQLTSTANYTSCCPDFTLQDVSVGGKTNTIGIVYIGNSSSINSFSVTGTGDGQRAVVVTCTCTTGINENDFDASINIFPNPASDKLTLILPDNISEADIYFFNILGEKKSFSKVNERETHIDISGLANGVYIIEMRIGNNIGRTKLIKL